MQRLVDLFFRKEAKAVDKWEHYLGIYDTELAYRRWQGQPLRLLEIGVQNGGSLELWAEYLPAGSSITGIDIDPIVSTLTFEHPAISVHHLDGTDPAGVERLLGEQEFDVIIDDGSHRSNDVVKSFEIFEKRLAWSGLYFVEDLHASYFPGFEGGYRLPHASVEWLKEFVDGLNADHLPIDQLEPSKIGRLVEAGTWLKRITFYESMAVLEKLPSKRERRYRRVYSGAEASVVPETTWLPQYPTADLNLMLFGEAAARRLDPMLVETLGQQRVRIAELEAQLNAMSLQMTELQDPLTQL